MKISAIAIALCMAVSSMAQTASFEKQALVLAQGILASELDASLPKRPFATWFNQLVGPQAGVVWQLTDCGERSVAGRDLPACAEVNACLPDGRVVIVMITVGTFKKGLTGKPAFFRAVVEHDQQLSQTLRLRDVPGMLTASIAPSANPLAKKPERQPVKLPAINASRTRIKLPSQLASRLPSSLNDNPRSSDVNREETPPPPPLAPQIVVQAVPQILDESEPPSPPQPAPQSVPKEPQKVSEGGLRANSIAKAKPVYPQSAKTMNALGEVKVQIIISESGRVISAKAVSGHVALRSAAVEAAFKWVFKAITFNGVPVKAEGTLTFNFMPGDQ